MTPDHETPILKLLRQGADYRFKIKTRGLEVEVRPLSILEEDRITQEVVDQMLEQKAERRTSMRETLLLTTKKLEAASSSGIDTNDSALRVAELERMTPAEIDSLFKQWVAGCDRVNPMLQRMNPTELTAMVEGLKKNSSGLDQTLIETSFFVLVDLCRHLITGDSPTGS